jgi:hypothetical protein
VARAKPPITYSSVDLPQPDGPDRHKISGKHLKIDAAKRRHVHLAGTIGLPEILGFEYRLHNL